MTMRMSDKDRESIYNHEAMQVESIMDELENNVLAAADPTNGGNGSAEFEKNKSLDDVSLDSFQLINNEDEQMNNYLGGQD